MAFRINICFPIQLPDGDVDVDMRSPQFPSGSEKAMAVSILRRCADYLEAREDAIKCDAPIDMKPDS